MVTCRAGCGQTAVVDAIRQRGLWPSDRDHKDTWEKKKYDWFAIPVPPVVKLPDGGKWPDGVPFPTHQDLGTPSGVVWFHNEAGEVVIGETRFDITGANGKPDKQYRPLAYCRRDDGARCDWRWKGLPKPWPLFDLPALVADPTKPVVITEGARKAETARELFPDFAATAALFGAKSPEYSDWSHVLGRDCIIWPDHDAAGISFAAKVAALCIKAGAKSVSIVEIPADWPKKWDLRDPLPDGVTDETLLDLLRSAQPWQPATDTASEAMQTAGLIKKRKYLDIGSDVEIAERVANDLVKVFGNIVFTEGGHDIKGAEKHG